MTFILRTVKHGQASDGYSSVSAGVARRLRLLGPLRLLHMSGGWHWGLPSTLPRPTPICAYCFFMATWFLPNMGLASKSEPLRWPAGGHITSLGLVSTASSRGSNYSPAFGVSEAGGFMDVLKTSTAFPHAKEDHFAGFKHRRVCCVLELPEMNRRDGPCCG